MADNTKERTGERQPHVEPGSEWSVRYWTAVFGVSPEALRAAVLAVGTDARAVRTYLEAHRDADQKSGDASKVFPRVPTPPR